MILVVRVGRSYIDRSRLRIETDRQDCGCARHSHLDRSHEQEKTEGQSAKYSNEPLRYGSWEPRKRSLGRCAGMLHVLHASLLGAVAGVNCRTHEQPAAMPLTCPKETLVQCTESFGISPSPFLCSAKISGAGVHRFIIHKSGGGCAPGYGTANCPLVMAAMFGGARMTIQRAFTESVLRAFASSSRGPQSGAGKVPILFLLNSFSVNYTAPVSNALRFVTRETAVTTNALKQYRQWSQAPVSSGAAFHILMIVEEDALIKRRRRNCQQHWHRCYETVQRMTSRPATVPRTVVHPIRDWYNAGNVFQPSRPPQPASAKRIRSGWFMFNRRNPCDRQRPEPW